MRIVIIRTTIRISELLIVMQTQGKPCPVNLPAAPESLSAQADLSTQQLFQGRQEIVIDHKGEGYRLRITKNDKLILTK